MNAAVEYETPWGGSLQLVQATRVTAPTSRSRCPDCLHDLVDRAYGVWCPACRGWLVEVTKPDGSAYAFIQGARL